MNDALAGIRKITERTTDLHRRAKALNEGDKNRLDLVEDLSNQADQSVTTAIVDLTNADVEAKRRLVGLALKQSENLAKNSD